MSAHASTYLAAGSDNQALTGSLFVAVVLVTVAITFWASRQTRGTTDYYAGGRSFTGAQNGLAVSGDYMSAASFLGISGAIALSGYDRFLYSIGSWSRGSWPCSSSPSCCGTPAVTRWPTSSPTE